jgi:hypothetical protein
MVPRTLITDTVIAVPGGIASIPGIGPRRFVGNGTWDLDACCRETLELEEQDR